MPDTISVKDASGADVTVNTNDALLAVLGALNNTKEIDPDAASATIAALLRGVIQTNLDATFTKGTAAAPGSDYISSHARTTGQVLSVFTTPTVTAGAYSAGDVVGGEQTIANAARVSGGGGVISQVGMFSEGGTIAANDIEVIFFTSNPASTYDDNAALPIGADADGFLILGSVILDTVVDVGDGFFLYARNVNLPYICTGSTSLFAVAVERSGTFAPDATDGVGFVYGLLRD
ncbi:MAG: hypothetical protein MJE12_09055 [Alphaproteobacteria bacterium]|nr:hypothetical protein [Alphaproteobacteria bacterium]